MGDGWLLVPVGVGPLHAQVFVATHWLHVEPTGMPQVLYAAAQFSSAPTCCTHVVPQLQVPVFPEPQGLPFSELEHVFPFELQIQLYEVLPHLNLPPQLWA